MVRSRLSSLDSSCAFIQITAVKGKANSVVDKKEYTYRFLSIFYKIPHDNVQLNLL
jgi:hypothetical protein